MIIDRLITLFDRTRTAAWFEEQTGIERHRWQNVRAKKVRLSESEIEAVLGLLPQYRWWLITGEVIPELGQTSPEHEEKTQEGLTEHFSRYRIIDSVDPRAMNTCIVKPTELRKLIFLVDKEDDWHTSALLLVGPEQNFSSQPLGRTSVWLKAGHMNFKSNGGGRLVLRDVRDWIMSNNEGLLAHAEIRAIESDCMNNVYRTMSIPTNALSSVDGEGEVFNRFLKWREGHDLYTAYGYNPSDTDN